MSCPTGAYPAPSFPRVGTAAPRGRLAPSPTGRLHLGNAYAFLCAWLHTRKQNGTLVLRMEDIDPDRSRPEYAEQIMRDLAWLGIDWDEGPDKPGMGGPSGPYRQSARLAGYEAAVDRLRALGLIYPCYCTRKELRTLASAPHVGDEGAPYPGTCRSLPDSVRAVKEAQGRRPAIRLNTAAALRLLHDRQPQGGSPAGPDFCLEFDDAVRGRQRYGMADCGGDFALRRSDGVFAYQLAVVLDDAAMGITDVVRGDDLLLSTPRQLLLYALLGEKPPAYAHLPLLHDSRGERLAKRHKSLELAALREAGVRPEAIIGYLGWLAGLMGDAAAPVPARPADLIPAWQPGLLASRYLQLDENTVEALGGSACL